MLPQLDEKAKDIAFAQGLLEEWGKTQPAQIADYLNTLTHGVDYWRTKYFDLQTDYETLNGNYTNLTVVHGQTLQQLQFMKDQETERLIEEQKEFWPKHENNLERPALVVPSGTIPG